MKFALEDKDSEKDKNVLEYKILLLGEKSVGKSSICTRFALNEFNLEIKPTILSECYTKSLKLFEQVIKVYFIDIDESVMSNDRSNLYNDVKGALIIYDITKSKSFEKVDNWVLDIRQNTSMNIPLILVGNKSDLTFLRNVDKEEGLEKSNALNCEFVETSCIDTISVNDAFKLLVSKIYYQDLPESKKNYFKIALNLNNNIIGNNGSDSSLNEEKKEDNNVIETLTDL